ncbi:MAG TPA: DNA-binding response regulator, partial [Lachnospiraceae bacterium]|nr:DNA-binding response regulator [Lachnospiraceae bacterium]
MLNIAVVDDEQVHRDILVKYITEWEKHKSVDAEVETFHSSDAFYFTWCEDQRFDVLFLDICMDGTDGVSLARKLREKGKT